MKYENMTMCLCILTVNLSTTCYLASHEVQCQAGGGALVHQGGYDAGSWTLKIDPNQVFGLAQKYTLLAQSIFETILISLFHPN